MLGEVKPHIKQCIDVSPLPLMNLHQLLQKDSGSGIREIGCLISPVYIDVSMWQHFNFPSLISV